MLTWVVGGLPCCRPEEGDRMCASCAAGGCASTSARLENSPPAHTCLETGLWRAWSMGWVGNPQCGAADNVLVARVTHFGRPWSLTF